MKTLFSMGLGLVLATQVHAKSKLLKAAQGAIPPVTVSIDHEVYYDSSLSEASIGRSQINFDFGNQIVDEVVKNFQIHQDKVQKVHKWTVSTTISISLAPQYLKDDVTSEVASSIPFLVDLNKANVIAGQIAPAVDAQLALSEVYLGSPPEQRAAIREQLINQAYEQAKPQIVAAITQQKEDNIDQVEVETSFQTLMVEVAYTFSSKTLLFAKLGKNKLSAGPTADIRGYSEVDNMIVGNNKTQRLTSVFGTTMVSLGAVSKMKDYSLTWTVSVFKDRPPAVDAKSYIRRIVSMTEDELEKHKELDELDSAVLHMILKNQVSEVYISTGSYDGANAYSLGGNGDLPKGFKLFVDYAQSDRKDTASESLSVIVSKKYGTRVKIYAGYEYVRDSKEYRFYSKGLKADTQEGKIGAQLVLYKGEIFNRYPAFLTTSIELFQEDIDYNNLIEVVPGMDDDDNRIDSRGGFEMQVIF